MYHVHVVGRPYHVAKGWQSMGSWVLYWSSAYFRRMSARAVLGQEHALRIQAQLGGGGAEDACAAVWDVNCHLIRPDCGHDLRLRLFHHCGHGYPPRVWEQVQRVQLGLAWLPHGDELRDDEVVDDLVRHQTKREKSEELAGLLQGTVDVPQDLPMLTSASKAP